MAGDTLPSTFQFQLVTPEKIFFSGEAHLVTIPGSLGVFGVLPGHAPFVSTLKPGVITIDLPDASKKRVVVLSGLAEVVPEHCTVLAESAEECTVQNAGEAEVKLMEAKRAAEDAVTEAQKKDTAHRLAVAEAVAGSFQH